MTNNPQEQKKHEQEKKEKDNLSQDVRVEPKQKTEQEVADEVAKKFRQMRSMTDAEEYG